MAYTKTIWENSPSENTPLSAENLNNIENGIDEVDTRLTTVEAKIIPIEKYLTATAGSDGDFKVNIPNTLETGMILNITFPTATNEASNARLSIDGGVSYKNIKYENTIQAVASDIQNQRYSFFYNGTDFIVEDNKEKVLYFDASGTTSTITFPETSANFAYLEILYGNSTKAGTASARVYNPNGKGVDMGIFTYGSPNLYINTTRARISGTAFTPTQFCSTEFKTGNSYTINATINPINVYRILGFRK